MVVLNNWQTLRLLLLIMLKGHGLSWFSLRQFLKLLDQNPETLGCWFSFLSLTTITKVSLNDLGPSANSFDFLGPLFHHLPRSTDNSSSFSLPRFLLEGFTWEETYAKLYYEYADVGPWKDLGLGSSTLTSKLTDLQQVNLLPHPHQPLLVILKHKRDDECERL